jgi:hypothetical protein
VLIIWQIDFQFLCLPHFFRLNFLHLIKEFMKATSVICFLFIALSLKNVGQGIVIDHNCTAIEQIPASVIDDVQQGIRWQYAHTSYGHQLTCGLELLEAADPSLDVEIGLMYLPVVPGALCTYDGTEGFNAPGVCCTYIEPVGYWLGEQGQDWTRATLNNNPTLNVSAWSWCDQLDEYTEAEVQTYLDAISMFESEYPDVTFIYFTGSAHADGALGYNRHLRNDMIRNFCVTNNKVLFDFEDIDTWYNGTMNYYLYSGDTIPLHHDAFYDPDGCGHANDLCGVEKGKATWWMMARLSGWQPGSGTSYSLQLKVFLEGSLNQTTMNTDLNSNGLIPLTQPYNTSPWNYSGDEAVSVIPNASVVDWILVELRDAPNAGSATAATRIGRLAGFVLNNGSIVGTDGSSNLQFTTPVSQNLFLVIWHRNHLGIMSSSPLPLNGEIYSYNFTQHIVKSYGGSNGCKFSPLGFACMVAGDSNHDGYINLTDKTEYWADQAGNSGYLDGDYSMEGRVNNRDKNTLWLPNFIVGYHSMVP